MMANVRNPISGNAFSSLSLVAPRMPPAFVRSGGSARCRSKERPHMAGGVQNAQQMLLVVHGDPGGTGIWYKELPCRSQQ